MEILRETAWDLQSRIDHFLSPIGTNSRCSSCNLNAHKLVSEKWPFQLESSCCIAEPLSLMRRLPLRTGRSLRLAVGPGGAWEAETGNFTVENKWNISLASGNPYPFTSFTHLSYTRDMTWISYLEKVMTSYTMDMTWIFQMQII